MEIYSYNEGKKPVLFELSTDDARSSTFSSTDSGKIGQKKQICINILHGIFMLDCNNVKAHVSFSFDKRKGALEFPQCLSIIFYKKSSEEKICRIDIHPGLTTYNGEGKRVLNYTPEGWSSYLKEGILAAKRKKFADLAAEAKYSIGEREALEGYKQEVQCLRSFWQGIKL